MPLARIACLDAAFVQPEQAAGGHEVPMANVAGCYKYRRDVNKCTLAMRPAGGKFVPYGVKALHTGNSVNNFKVEKLGSSLVSIVMSLMFAGTAQAAPTLAPVFAGNGVLSGAQAGHGLAGNWYKVDDNARFSEALWTEGSNDPAPFKSFSWGTGFWSVDDIAQFTSGANTQLLATTSSVSAVSFANHIYNNLYGAGGTQQSQWSQDHDRTLAPIVTACGATPGSSTADCETNYAAVFTGYVYVADPGSYDFGIFADDGFAFSLLGASGTRLTMGRDGVAGSQGRAEYSLVHEQGLDELFLDSGYYGINLSYFNRLSAGVIDLSWTGPDSGWRTIAEEDLFQNYIPEPGSLSLMALACLGLWATRKNALRSFAVG